MRSTHASYASTMIPFEMDMGIRYTTISILTMMTPCIRSVLPAGHQRSFLQPPTYLKLFLKPKLTTTLIYKCREYIHNIRMLIAWFFAVFTV